MFLETVSTIGMLSITIVERKFPKEFYDLKYRQTIFELVEIVSDELGNKNMNLFTDVWIDKLTPIKEINIY